MNSTYNSDSILSVVQELYASYAPYAAGVMAFEYLDATITDNQYQVGWSYDSSAAKAPLLVITYAPNDCYWVGAGGTWSDAATHWATSTGGAANALNLPASNSTVHFDASSGFIVGNKTVTVSANAYCHDMDWTGSPNSPALFQNNCWLDISGSLTFIAGMSYTSAGTIGTNFSSNSTENITTNGVTIPVYYAQFTTTGKYTLQDNFTASNTVYWGQGTGGELDTNGKTVTCGGFTDNNYATAKILTLGASAINCTSWFVNATGTTFNKGTSTITVTAGGFTGGGLTYNNVVIVGTTGSVGLGGANTFANLTFTGTAVKTDYYLLKANQNITGTLTMNGNSAINRILVESDTPATRRILTAAVVSASNVDLLDIQGAGASWDLSAITGGSGDAGHNAGITFTTPVDRYWRTDTGVWSDTAQWAATIGGGVGASVPLIQDTAHFDANSITMDSRVINMDMPRIGNINMTGVTRVPQFDGDGAGGGTVNLWGDVILGDVNWTPVTTNFYGRGTQEIWSNSEQFDCTNVYLYNYGAVWHIEDNFITTGVLNLEAGTLNMQGLQITANAFKSLTTTYTRSLAWQGGEFYLTYAAPVWDVSPTNFTIGTNTGDIVFNPVSGNASLTSGGFTTYNEIIVQGSTNYTMTFVTAFTCNILRVDRSLAAKTVSGAIVVTLNTGMSIPVSGTTVVTITNTDFHMHSGTVASTYLSISGSTADGGATYLAGVAPPSTNGGGNSGWSFTDPTVPTIAIGTATGLTTTSATLHGTVSAMGTFTPLYGFFQYGITASYDGTWVTTAEIVPPITANGDYSLAVAGLSGDVNYNIRFVVRYNIGDYTYSSYGAFNTSGAPIVVTLDIALPTATTATLQGNLSSLGIYADSNVYFQYGNTATYDATWSQTEKVHVDVTGAFSKGVSGLVQGVTYYYRALADYTGAASPATGGYVSFTLLPTGSSTTLSLITLGVFSGYITPSTGATITNGTGTMTGSTLSLAVGDQTPTVTVAGTFDVAVPTGAKIIVSSGGWTVVSSPVEIVSSNVTKTFTVQAGGAGTINVRFATDMLIVAEVFDKYSGSYLSKKASDCFQLRLYDTDLTTVLAASPIQNWGDRPASIYLNSSVTDNMTLGAAYGVQLYGYNVSGNPKAPTTPRVLTNADWRGTDLTYLDDLCISIAQNMAETDHKTDYTAILPNGMTVVDTATGYFVSGIPDIATIRPNLFTISELNMAFPSTSDMNAWDVAPGSPGDYSTYIGANLSSDLAVFGVPLGINGKNLGAGLIWFVVILVVGLTVASGAKPLGALLICVPLLWLGTYFKILPVQQLLILCIGFGFFFIRQFIIKTT